jgi:hypothetical protein
LLNIQKEKDKFNVLHGRTEKHEWHDQLAGDIKSQQLIFNHSKELDEHAILLFFKS